jgi:hypothetical protein
MGQKMARKTFDVNQVVLKVNEMLAISTCSPEVRQGAMNVLETVLHETGNYRGFRYLLQGEVPAGELPGVNYKDGQLCDMPERFENTDRTRAYYFFA